MRPDQWILDNNVFVGSAIPIHIEELDVHGTATVNALSACPNLAFGDGECVTGRFVTRQVAETIKITLDNGTQLEGTPVHPVWSVDREDFIELSELIEGERLQTADGPVAVATIEVRNVPVPVYNIEVRGQHVYEVTESGILVHNANGACGQKLFRSLENEGYLNPRTYRTRSNGEVVLEWEAAHIVPGGEFSKFAGGKYQKPLAAARQKLSDAKIDINSHLNGFWSTKASGHAGTHTAAYFDRLTKLINANTPDSQVKDALDLLWTEIKAGKF